MHFKVAVKTFMLLIQAGDSLTDVLRERHAVVMLWYGYLIAQGSQDAVAQLLLQHSTLTTFRTSVNESLQQFAKPLLCIVRMAFSKPSPHRCKILTVSRLLSKEDVDEILYLSEDFIPQSEVKRISSGLDLMRSQEHHKTLAPGKYSYLLACLKEIGRIDLARTLTEFIYSCLLESIPSSFRAPSQMYTAKLGILMNKQSRYVEGMRNLQAAAGNLHFWEKWISSTFHHLLKCTSNSTPILPVNIPELLQLILEGVVNVTVPWTGAVLAFLQGTNDNQFGRKLQDIQLHKAKLFGDLSGAGLSEILLQTEHPQHLDVAISAASYALFDFLSELLGKAVDSEKVETLLKSLSDIESITPENNAFETLPSSVVTSINKSGC